MWMSDSNVPFGGYGVLLAVEAVTLLLLAVSVALHVLSMHRRFPPVTGAESVLSNPPASAVYTEPSIPPDETVREVLAAATSLVLTRDERVVVIRAMMARTGEGLELLHRNMAPGALLESAHHFRREAYEWIADDDEELRDDWWNCVMGTGRWGDA